MIAIRGIPGTKIRKWHMIKNVMNVMILIRLSEK